MATTGTHSFNPTAGALGAYALGRCGIRRAAILAEHMADVAMAANLVLSDWSNQQPNLWTVTLASIVLTQGNPGPYTLTSDVILPLDVYVTTTAEGDRIIYPASESEYAAFPNKTQQAPPTVFWFRRIATPEFYVYPAPDGNGPYTLNYYAVHQDQDAANGAQLDLPYRYLKAFADSMAAELALIYAPDRYVVLSGVAAASKQRADEQDRENVPLFIMPALSGYYRR